jgi:hypothetical protein
MFLFNRSCRGGQLRQDTLLKVPFNVHQLQHIIVHGRELLLGKGTPDALPMWL